MRSSTGGVTAVALLSKPMLTVNDVLALQFPPGAKAAKQAYVHRLGLRPQPNYLLSAAAVQGQTEAVTAWNYGTAGSASRLDQIKQPVLVADGASDIVAPVGNSEKLAAGMPGAKLVKYSGAGHGFIS